MNKTQYKELNREYLALKATEPGVENIGGWQIALTHMKVGDKWELTIPAELGYGSARVEGIPAHSTMIFTLELLQIA